MIDIGSAAVLRDGGRGIRFAVRVAAGDATAFAVRHSGQVHAFLNRCAHVAMELDWVAGDLFDADGRWLVCAAHGALYEPASGRCAGGPCSGRGGLLALQVVERDGRLYWVPSADVQPPG